MLAADGLLDEVALAVVLTVRVGLAHHVEALGCRCVRRLIRCVILRCRQTRALPCDGMRRSLIGSLRIRRTCQLLHFLLYGWLVARGLHEIFLLDEMNLGGIDAFVLVVHRLDRIVTGNDVELDLALLVARRGRQDGSRSIAQDDSLIRDRDAFRVLHDGLDVRACGDVVMFEHDIVFCSERCEQVRRENRNRIDALIDDVIRALGFDFSSVIGELHEEGTNADVLHRVENDLGLA